MNATRSTGVRTPNGFLPGSNIPTRRRSRARRLLASLVLLMGLLGFAVPARAGNVVCVTLYYYFLGSGPQYVQNNNCYVPTTWLPVGGVGLDCYGDASLIRVCWKVTASFDVP